MHFCSFVNASPACLHCLLPKASSSAAACIAPALLKSVPQSSWGNFLCMYVGMFLILNFSDLNPSCLNSKILPVQYIQNNGLSSVRSLDIIRNSLVPGSVLDHNDGKRRRRRRLCRRRRYSIERPLFTRRCSGAATAGCGNATNKLTKPIAIPHGAPRCSTHSRPSCCTWGMRAGRARGRVCCCRCRRRSEQREAGF